MAWIAAVVFFLVISYLTVLSSICIAILISAIALLQTFVYGEACRHEKQTLSQQVSVEARAKFKREKKALKLTTIILVTIFLCFALPSFILFLIWYIFSETFSLDVKTLVRHLGLVPMMTSSVVNPFIYTVRKYKGDANYISTMFKDQCKDWCSIHETIKVEETTSVTQGTKCNKCEAPLEHSQFI